MPEGVVKFLTTTSLQVYCGASRWSDNLKIGQHWQGYSGLLSLLAAVTGLFSCATLYKLVSIQHPVVSERFRHVRRQKNTRFLWLLTLALFRRHEHPQSDAHPPKLTDRVSNKITVSATLHVDRSYLRHKCSNLDDSYFTRLRKHLAPGEIDRVGRSLVTPTSHEEKPK